MKKHSERTYWISNKEWYRINEKGCYELTDAAPERAQKSFEMWNKPEPMTAEQFFRIVKRYLTILWRWIVERRK